MFGTSKRQLRAELNDWKRSYLKAADESQELLSQVDTLTYKNEQMELEIVRLRNSQIITIEA